MGQYGATGVDTEALNAGDVVAVVTAADTAGGALTQSQSVAIQQGAGGAVEGVVTVHNLTNQTATVVCAPVDTAASYSPLTNANTAQAVTVAKNISAVFTCVGPFMGLTFATSPTAGAAYISR